MPFNRFAIDSEAHDVLREHSDHIRIGYKWVTFKRGKASGRIRWGVSMDIQFDSLRCQRYWNVFSYAPQILGLKRPPGHALNLDIPLPAPITLLTVERSTFAV
jgi:hypothetical protein